MREGSVLLSFHSGGGGEPNTQPPCCGSHAHILFAEDAGRRPKPGGAYLRFHSREGEKHRSTLRIAPPSHPTKNLLLLLSDGGLHT